MHRAAENGKFEIVKLLLESGANVDAENLHGNTALQYIVNNYAFSNINALPTIKLLIRAGTKIPDNITEIGEIV